MVPCFISRGLVVVFQRIDGLVFHSNMKVSDSISTYFSSYNPHTPAQAPEPCSGMMTPLALDLHTERINTLIREVFLK